MIGRRPGAGGRTDPPAGGPGRRRSRVRGVLFPGALFLLSLLLGAAAVLLAPFLLRAAFTLAPLPRAFSDLKETGAAPVAPAASSASGPASGAASGAASAQASCPASCGAPREERRSVASPSLVTFRDRDGEALVTLARADESFLPLALGAADPLLARATLAAEDRRFFRHAGVDAAAVLRAAYQNLRTGRRVSGGSTLTQQLVKLVLASEGGEGEGEGRRPTAGTKLREALLALRVEAHCPKERILEAYLNRACYGATIRGAAAASVLYFGHTAERLRVEEAALLAALPQSPVRLDPFRNPEGARNARNRVLRRMGLPQAEEESACLAPLLLSPPARQIAGCAAPHWVRRELPLIPAETGEVVLPCDRRIQKLAREALTHTLAALAARGADDGAVVVIHNPTGEMRAYVGSPDWSQPAHGQFDAASALRQPGSALKPFTYALAFEEGMRPSTLLPDLPLSFRAPGGTYRPRNYSGAYHGPVRARAALAGSRNAPAVAVLGRIGPDALCDLLRSAGIRSLREAPEHYGLGLTLGDAEVSLVELATAYSCLARGGWYLPRKEILSPGADGATAHGSAADGFGTDASDTDETSGARRVLSPEAAFWVTSILSDGRSRAAVFGLDGLFSFDFPAAVKTGTSTDWRDNWAFGYTKEWTAGVWVGAAAGTPMDRVSGTQGAMLALAEILSEIGPEPRPAASGAVSGEASGPFSPPATLEERPICALSGELATTDCPERMTEWFLRSDPAPPCRWHRRVRIDAATGLLARACTPSDRVREVLYTWPPDPSAGPGPAGAGAWDFARGDAALFAQWARDQGWPAPPEDAAAAVEPGARPSRLPRRAPSPRCRIVHPADGAVYALDPSLPSDQQEIALEAAGGGAPYRWKVDGREVGAGGERIYWRLQPGRHRIEVTSATGPPSRAEVRIEVESER